MAHHPSTSSTCRAISTWNVWGVPFAAPLVFHRAKRWRHFHDQQLQQLLEKTKDPPIDPERDLVVCCFQEVFSFPKGPLMDCISRFDARGVTPFWERCVLSLGILCRPLSCCVWDQAQKLYHGSQLDPRIEYAAVVGKGGMSLPCNSLVDSGLCILSTREPTEKGFVAYKNYPAGLHEERLANKGLMWAYWSFSVGRGVLVVNTHLSSQRKVRPDQLEELGDHLEVLREEFRVKAPSLLEVYVCGDFNLDPKRDEFFETWYQHLGLTLLTSGAVTNASLSVALDHILAWRSDGSVSAASCSPPMKPWKDGPCDRSRDAISDHCWQGIIFGPERQPQ